MKRRSIVSVTAVLAASLTVPTLALTGDDPLAAPFPETLEVTALDGRLGFAFSTDDSATGVGFSLANAGDVDGDGLDDVIVGAPGGGGRGTAFVIFGRAGTTAPVLNPSDLDGTLGFRIEPTAPMDVQLGYRVAGGADLNNDGIDDIILGLPRANPGPRGAVYVIFGRRTFPPAISTEGLDGTNGFVISSDGFDHLGESISAGGDINGDGIDDLIIGAPQQPGGGKAIVVFGRPGDFPPLLDALQLPPGEGFLLQGEAGSDEAGRTVVGLGDVSGDGLADFAVGAPRADGGPRDSGRVYVVFGRDGSPGSTFPPVMALGDPTAGFIINGQDDFAALGLVVASAGDVNADGLADIALGSPNIWGPAGREGGVAVVVFGQSPDAPDFVAEIDLASLRNTDGFRMAGTRQAERLGTAVAGLGDVNDDGVDDLLVGAPTSSTSGTQPGAAYVVYGRTAGFPLDMTLERPVAFGGFLIEGEHPRGRAGSTAAGGGDINGDGIADILLGAPEALIGPGPTRGEVYIVLGRRAPCPADADCDGALTANDLLTVLNRFDAGDLAADFDGDGVLTIFDLLAFQNAFDAGC